MPIGRKVRFKGWDCVLEFSKYQDNKRTALLLRDATTGEVIAVASVNIPEEPLLENEVFIKDYSENEGILKALANAGIVRSTGEFIKQGFVMIPKCILLVTS